MIEEEGKKKIAGEVRLLAEANDEEAEFAIVVADPWQGMGLGNRLTDYVMEIAHQRKFRQIYANVLKMNKVMIHIFRKRGFALKAIDFSTYYASLELQEVGET